MNTSAVANLGQLPVPFVALLGDSGSCVVSQFGIWEREMNVKKHGTSIGVICQGDFTFTQTFKREQSSYSSQSFSNMLICGKDPRFPTTCVSFFLFCFVVVPSH